MLELVPLRTPDAEKLFGWVRAYYEHDGLAYDSRVEAGVRELLAHPEYGRAWAITSDGKEVGYCVITFGFDHEQGGRLASVTDLYLGPDSRGQGLGSLVLDKITDFAKEEGLKQVELWVLDHNSGARKLYERKGFRAFEGRTCLWLDI